MCLAIETAPDEPTPMEKRPFVHLVIQFSVDVSKQLFAVLGYLYPLLGYEHPISYKSETAGGGGGGLEAGHWNGSSSRVITGMIMRTILVDEF
jgi:hypothetical protein